MDLQPIQNLLEKRISRREFLAYSGAVILGIVGISGLLRLLANPYHHDAKRGPGYGGSNYGGK